MADFKGSFKDGLALAKIAEANRAEVDSVFEELNRQLGEETGGMLFIKREYLDEPVTNVLETLSLKPRDKFWAITARNKFVGNVPSDVLARWEQAPAGYPCQITLRNQVMICENKEGLERGLSALLSDAAVGETLYRIVRS